MFIVVNSPNDYNLTHYYLATSMSCRKNASPTNFWSALLGQTDGCLFFVLFCFFFKNLRPSLQRTDKNNNAFVNLKNWPYITEGTGIPILVTELNDTFTLMSCRCYSSVDCHCFIACQLNLLFLCESVEFATE